jgi:hypothetical protein
LQVLLQAIFYEQKTTIWTQNVALPHIKIYLINT